MRRALTLSAAAVLLPVVALQPRIVALDQRTVALDPRTTALDRRVVPLDRTLVDLNTGTTTVEGGDVVELRLSADVFFAFGQFALTPHAEAALRELIPHVQRQARGAIAIEGHTDSVDDDAFNQTLSQQRADAVREFLAGGGLGDRTFTVQGFGEAQPVAPNMNLDGTDNPAGRALNRRVTIRYAPLDQQEETP